MQRCAGLHGGERAVNSNAAVPHAVSRLVGTNATSRYALVRWPDNPGKKACAELPSVACVLPLRLPREQQLVSCASHIVVRTAQVRVDEAHEGRPPSSRAQGGMGGKYDEGGLCARSFASHISVRIAPCASHIRVVAARLHIAPDQAP